MIVLFTDFGQSGLYTGQVQAVLQRDAPGVPVIDLVADAPAYRIQAAAYLLASLRDAFPRGSVFLCVVDPGVGGPRRPGVLAAGGQWFVGPDNGLFEVVARRAGEPLRWWEVTWTPPRLSATFHGRDLFAPLAAALARGLPPPGIARPVGGMRRADWPDDLAEIIYIDGYGNAITGVRASSLPEGAGLTLGRTHIRRARTFSDAPQGALICYANANGLMEIAANQSRAADMLSLAPGVRIGVSEL